MRILMLGGPGFLSGRIAALALARGHDKVCASRGPHGRPPAAARWIRWDRGEDAPPESSAGGASTWRSRPPTRAEELALLDRLG